MRRMSSSGLFTLVGLALAVAGPAMAQATDGGTRQGVIAEAQASKQRVLAPPRANLGEVVVDRLENWGFLRGEPRGLYPVIASIYPGGGFAAGVGARRPFGDDGAVKLVGAYSLAGFWHLESDMALPTFANNRARVTVTGRYLDAPDVKYYGVGNDTNKDDSTRFGYTPKGGGAQLDVEISKYLSVGGGVRYLDIVTSAGKTAPSIEARFSPADTPGLELDSFRYLNSTAHAAFDWRRPLGYTGAGGLYSLRFDDYRERDRDRYSYRSVEAQALQRVSLLRANWVIELRGLATITDIDDTAAVPYFMLPSLGGGRTLRGFPDFRFRDRNRLQMTAELRWTPARFLDMAIFYDAGKVAARRTDLDFDNLHGSYGVGLRVVGMKGYAFRVEVAHSREHAARLLINAGGTF